MTMRPMDRNQGSVSRGTAPSTVSTGRPGRKWAASLFQFHTSGGWAHRRSTGPREWPRRGRGFEPVLPRPISSARRPPDPAWALPSSQRSAFRPGRDGSGMAKEGGTRREGDAGTQGGEAPSFSPSLPHSGLARWRCWIPGIRVGPGGCGRNAAFLARVAVAEDFLEIGGERGVRDGDAAILEAGVGFAGFQQGVEIGGEKMASLPAV